MNTSQTGMLVANRLLFYYGWTLNETNKRTKQVDSGGMQSPTDKGLLKGRYIFIKKIKINPETHNKTNRFP